MIKVTETVAISSSPTEVFAFISNLDNIPLWDREVKNFTLVTPGAAGVGSRFVEETKIGTVNCEVTEFSANKAIAFNGTSSAMDLTERILIEPGENGAIITLTGTAEPKGLLKLLQPIIAAEFKNSSKQQLVALKNQLEKM